MRPVRQNDAAAFSILMWTPSDSDRAYRAHLSATALCVYSF